MKCTERQEVVSVRHTKSLLTFAARFINPALRMMLDAHRLALGTFPLGSISPRFPGTCCVTVACVPEAKAPVPVGSTIAWYGPAPSVVTMWSVPLRDPPSDTWGRVEPDAAMAADTIDTEFLPWPVVLPRPLVAALTELKTVVSTSVLELEPAPGTMPP